MSQKKSSPDLRPVKSLVWLLPLCLLLAGCGGASERSGSGPFKLRAQAQTIDDKAFHAMLKQQDFFDKRWNRYGDFPNRLTLKTIQGQKIVEDSAASLTWSYAGSEQAMRFQDCVLWLEQLNKKGYAGYSDWRVPTLEEAMSLLEQNTADGFHIDPIFYILQHSTWTSDMNSKTRGWSVSFNSGRAFKAYPNETIFLRPVRSGISR